MVAPPFLDQDEGAGTPLADYSPEARRRTALARPQTFASLPAQPPALWQRFLAVSKRVLVGCFNDGFIHAGNLAYLSMLAIFPFFITGAAVFSVIGEESDRAATISAIVAALPPVVGETIEPVARNVVSQRNGWLLWIGGLVGLWTVSGLIETIRDILRRSYGTRPTRAFWMNRILSSGIILAAMLLLMMSLIAQVAIGAAQEIISAYFPQLEEVVSGLGWSRIVPMVGLFGSIFMLFLALTPSAYRAKIYPKWPGALLVTLWWATVTALLPKVLSSLLSYNATYGSLAGMMIALFFFWLVGLGVVAGAELNAALAEPPDDGSDNPAEDSEPRALRGAQEEVDG